MLTARNIKFDDDFKKVKEFYSKLRGELYKDLRQSFSQFTTTSISYGDCLEADSWKKIEPTKRNDWHWVNAYQQYKKSFKRFDIAFKQQGKLVSLSYGVPTAHKTGLKVELIESTPFTDDKLGVKSFRVISYAAQVYAAMLGANEIRIMKPTSPESLAHYCSFGYEYVSNEHKPSIPDYCVMKLR